MSTELQIDLNNFVPAGPISSAYMASRAPICMLVGPYGAGKSVSVLVKLFLMALEQTPINGVARSRYILSRLTRPQLVAALLNTFKMVFPETEGFAPVESAALKTVWRFRPPGFTHDVEIEWLFLALETEDDIARVLGAEATAIYVDEARLIDAGLLGKLVGRLRYPAVSKHYSLELSTNPWDTTHPFHELFVLNPVADVAFFHLPGGLDRDAAGNWLGENLHNLNQTAESKKLDIRDPLRRELGIQYYLRLARNSSPEDARLNVHSKFGVSRDGKPVYGDYDDSAHCVPLKFDAGMKLELGTDFGLNSATVLYQQSIEGHIRVLAEFVTEDQGTVAHHERLTAFIAREFPGANIGRCTGDPAGQQRSGGGKETVFQLVRRFFPTYQPARTNEVALRIEAVNALFRRTIRGLPALSIDDKHCPTLRKACIDGFYFKRLKGTGPQHSEVPEKNKYSHIAEALAYAVLGAGGGRPGPLSGGRNAQDLDRDFAAACARRTSNPGGSWSPFSEGK